ncbi:TolB family protein [Pseudomonas sp. CGJS7]|uniref:TolB family protein n=1 Tax=Pseudomonas sp. CGJS7 TaxID=3109348 RepID=UPI003009FDA0
MPSIAHHALFFALSALTAASAFAQAPRGELVGPGRVSTAANETSATLTRDGAHLYFMRGDYASADTAILLADRVGDGWARVRVAPFSGVWRDSEPHIAPDGKRLYFVSNRPPTPDAAPLTTVRGGQSFPGANLWYVEARGEGWGEPVHIPGEVNRGVAVFNPSVAANGNLYFSAVREDSGGVNQLYLAKRNGEGWDAPQRLDVGVGPKANRMDPAIDPQERFMLFAGNEGDSRGAADIYIVFRDAQGGWGKPIALPGEVNSVWLENAPTLGRAFGEIFATSMRPQTAAFPKAKPDRVGDIAARVGQPLNGSRNLWRFDIAPLLREHGIQAEG